VKEILGEFLRPPEIKFDLQVPRESGSSPKTRIRLLPHQEQIHLCLEEQPPLHIPPLQENNHPSAPRGIKTNLPFKRQQIYLPLEEQLPLLIPPLQEDIHPSIPGGIKTNLPSKRQTPSSDPSSPNKTKDNHTWPFNLIGIVKFATNQPSHKLQTQHSPSSLH
jgi:hypothetical protein